MINSINILRAVRSTSLSIFLLISTGQVFAQSSSATLSGFVNDSSGQAVVGATVKAVNKATNRSFTTTSRNDGLYIFVELLPGNYRVEVEKEGFQRAVMENVTLNVAARATQDITLAVGEVSEVVTVEADQLIIERDSAVVSTVVDREFVENIPLNGRTFQSLLELTPGVVLTPPDATNPGQFSVNGQRSNSNYFIVDGIGANSGTTPIATYSQQAAGTLPSTTVTGGFNNLLSVDELEEFRVMTSTFAPEYGRSPGGQVIMQSRPGGSRFSGSVSHYVRNEVFDANNFFNNRNGIPRGVLRQNHFGFTVGGPVLLPIGRNEDVFKPLRDKTFFFVSYENMQVRQPVFRSANTPSQFARSEAARLGLTDIAEFLNGFPLPNAPSIVIGPRSEYVGRYLASISNPIKMNSWGVRLDHHFNSQFSIFGRYKRTPSENDQATTAFPNQTNYYNVTTKLFTGGATYAFSSQAVFDARLNITHDNGDFLFLPQDVDGAVVPPLSMLLPDYITEENASAGVQFGDLMNQTRGRTWGNGQKQLNFVGNLTYIAGNHQLKFGGDYRRLKPNVNARSFGYSYNFGLLDALLNENAPATFGMVRVNTQAFAPAGQFKFENYSLYGQDTWKANQRLTLTYGLRWDLNLPPSSDGALPYAIDGLNDPLTATLAAPGTEAFEAKYTNFAPRVGVAYSLNEANTFVLRGGVGLFYDMGTGQAVRGYTGFPFSTVRASQPIPFVLGSQALNDALQPLPFGTDPPYSSSFYVYNRDSGIVSPRVVQYNLALERSLGSNQSISVSFVGANGRKLLFTETLSNAPGIPGLGVPAKNWINPIFGGPTNSSFIYMTDNRGRSDYYALQFQFNRRLTRGLQAMASYSYSHSKDNMSSEIAGGSGAIRVSPDSEYGYSDFDVRHNYSAALTYRIPSPIKEGFGRKLLNGFAVDMITRGRSAPPYKVFVSYYDPATFTTYSYRPDVVSGQPLYIYDDVLPGGRMANINAFALPDPNTSGTMQRNALRGFNLFQTDLTLRREFKLNERFRVQLRGEAFNIFNQANFGTNFSNNYTAIRRQLTGGVPTDTLFTNVGLSTFTLSNQLGGTGGLNSLYTVGGPRSLQFAIKVLF
ncbi:MAG: TonB-dependent receptor [Acidobacteria bacterium]|nr:TonB-dependent receptor [Acidobacteriota bacterium]